jgi:hypothetical protein
MLEGRDPSCRRAHDFRSCVPSMRFITRTYPLLVEALKPQGGLERHPFTKGG